MISSMNTQHLCEKWDTKLVSLKSCMAFKKCSMYSMHIRTRACSALKLDLHITHMMTSDLTLTRLSH